jgi:hypothetical protein
MYGREDFLPVYVQNTQAELIAAVDNHPSEQGWKVFKDRCVVLDNEGSLNDLTDKIKKLIEENV